MTHTHQSTGGAAAGVTFPGDLFSKALAGNPAEIAIRADQLIRQHAGDRAVAAFQLIDLGRFAQLGLCELACELTPQPIFSQAWGGEEDDRLTPEFEQAVWRVGWRGHQLHVVRLQWQTSCGGETRDWVVAKSMELAEAFVLEVERKTHDPGNAILVFAGGHWDRNEALFAAVDGASFDTLVLADDLKATIRRDFSQFLDAEHQYQKMGLAWRRGALFIGPPGNGKTHCVRALIKELSIPCVYVQAITNRYATDQQMWRSVFERARSYQKCVIVLEDLDSLVNDENRSFFLNQLDGFERNHGMIILATTNYPEKIDPAIIDRPSRFDRKYHFDLPTVAERQTYLAAWQKRLESETGWRNDQVQAIAESTHGYSFAFLQELMISAALSWLKQTERPFLDVVIEQAELLASQMTTR